MGLLTSLRVRMEVLALCLRDKARQWDAGFCGFHGGVDGGAWLGVWDIRDREMGAFGVDGLASAVMEAVERAVGHGGVFH